MIQVLKAEEPVYGGYVLTRAEGIVFIRGAIPGEVVEVRVEEKKRDYTLASVVEVVESSPFRLEPPCPHFGSCGGCQLQFISYERQAAMKAEILVDCLKRLGGLGGGQVEMLPTLSGPDFGYRRRGQFKVSKEGKVGFYREATRDVVDLEACPLMCEGVNKALSRVRGGGSHLEGLREIHITHGDEGTLAFLKGVHYKEPLADAYLALGFSGVAFEDGAYRGSGPAYAVFDLNGMKYSVSPWSFLQSNWRMNRELVSLVLQGLGPACEGHRLLDLYAGAGNFSLHPALGARETWAVEDNPFAVKDGERNAAQNRVSNYRVVRATAEEAKLKGRFEVLILDPPRPGLTKAMMEKVLGLRPEKIAYISCNPSTLARDLKALSALYNVDNARVIDMFPHTYHIESLVFLTKKQAV